LTNFTELGLSKPTVSALLEKSYTQPTEIQEKAIPSILEGLDIMASAQTGSGKTAAFALPIIECLQFPDQRPRALVLVPTRELALQVEKEFKLFAKYSELRMVTIYGGTSFGPQVSALKRGVDVIVATPGRLIDCMERKIVDLTQIEMLVLDEADRLLDMGFMPQVRNIVSKLRKDRQTLMFSATIDRRIESLACAFLVDPVTIRVNSGRIEPTEIDQSFHFCDEFAKDGLLAKMLKDDQEMTSVLVFTSTKRKASWVCDRLNDANIRAEEIHSDISQSAREKTLADFRAGKYSVLVATDVAARGLDIPQISHVVNYDLPESADTYVHRIGRTGRAGRSGVALSFVSMAQRFLVSEVEKLMGRKIDSNAPERKAPIPMRRLSRPRRRMS
jgi:Superfamily II DNA and RNA helicases